MSSTVWFFGILFILLILGWAAYIYRRKKLLVERNKYISWAKDRLLSGVQGHNREKSSDDDVMDVEHGEISEYANEVKGINSCESTVRKSSSLDSIETPSDPYLITFVTYQSKTTNNFTLKYPRGWTVTENSKINASACCHFTSPTSEAFKRFSVVSNVESSAWVVMLTTNSRT